MIFSLLTGSEAMQAAETPAFQASWLALYRRCPWATACQHPDFVLPWYRLYGEQYLPVVVLSRSPAGDLLGLLTLARRRDGVLTGAGERQAEYQCWLADPGDGDAFIRSAMAGLTADFPGVDLCLRYLPPGVPLGWTADTGHCARYSVLRPHRRPVMHVEADAMGRQRNKKNHRQNFNRLGRIGRVAFEHVRCGERFAQVFEEICGQYDFRQAVLHRQTPFLSDPMKKRFFRELHARGLLHTTILTVDGKLAASHVGLLGDRGVLHLGINSHAPGFAAHSPGNLLLAMLGVYLAQEGLPMFDLTPGGDAYKEQLATGHDLVFELSVYGNACRKLASTARKRSTAWVKAGMHALGYRGAEVLTAMDALRHGGGGRIRALVRALRGRRGDGEGVLRCRVDAAAHKVHDITIGKNQVADLLSCDRRMAPTGYWGFLHRAMQRMERSHDCYTLAQDGRLLLACSVAEQPGGEMLLSDLYVDRETVGSEDVRSFFEQVLVDLQSRGREGTLCCACLPDPELRRVLVEIGFSDASRQTDGLSNPYQAPRLWEPGA